MGLLRQGGENGQLPGIRTAVPQGPAGFEIQIDIFQIRDFQLGQMAPAAGTIIFMTVENMDSLTVFAVVYVHHGGHSLPLGRNGIVTTISGAGCCGLRAHCVMKRGNLQEKAFDKKRGVQRG
ncbi:MAG: hypothetical protein DBX58_05125 [Clostridiales bacterium]|nr:MAG: hypothetical protein DBX58_05125 [Clostridiales bacterium]